MRHIISTTLAATLCVTLSFSGCGENTTQTGAKQPFNAQKLNREVSVKKDWTWSVSTEVDYSKNAISVTGWSGIPQSVKHLQIFIDSDNNKATGFSGANGWEIEGADILIEDGTIYNYIPNDRKEFSWTMDSSFGQAGFLSDDVAGGSRTYRLNNYHFGFSDLFKNSSKMNIMIEVYDANWNGNFNTVTDIDAEITKGDVLPPLKEYKLSATKHVKIHDKEKGDEEFDGSFEYVYDEMGQDGALLSKKIITEKGALASTTEYSYDDTDTLIQKVITKAGGLPHTYSYIYMYNDRGDIFSKTTFVDGKESRTTKYFYNENGQLTEENSGGTSTFYHYDDKGQLIQKTRKDPDGINSMTEDFTYDANGHMIQSVYHLFRRGNSVETTIHYTWGTL